MERKMYYQIDNNDAVVTCDLTGCMSIIAGESHSYSEKSNEEDAPQWIITPIWLTEEEYDNLPEPH